MPKSNKCTGGINGNLDLFHRICLKEGSRTLCTVIDRLGVERVKALNIISHTIPLISLEKLEAQQVRLGRYYIVTNTSTGEKAEQLAEISHRLKEDYT